MKLKRLAILGIMSVTLLAQSTVVFADSAITSEKSSASVDSNFGYNTGTAVVSIPTDLTLTKDESTNTYNRRSDLSAYGNIDASLKLKVETDDSITYASSEEDVDGTVEFGSGNNVAYWSASQLKSGVDTSDSRVSYPLDIEVKNADSIEDGAYNSNLTFDIELVDTAERKDLPETDASYFTFTDNTGSLSVDYVTYEQNSDTDVSKNIVTKTLEYTLDTDTVAITGLTEEGKALETIVTPTTYNGKKVTAIDANIFVKSSCKNLIISEGVEYIIGSNSHPTNSSVESIYFPDSLKVIKDSSFAGYYNLKSVRFGNSLEFIGEYAFYQDAKLASVKLPASLIAIDAYAFYENTALTKVYLAEGLKSIGYRAFAKTGLKQIILPSSLVLVGSGSFDDITSLEKAVVKLGANNVYMAGIFRGCTNLKVVFLPVNTVRGNGDGAIESFNGDAKLTDVYIYGSQSDIPTNIPANNNISSMLDYTNYQAVSANTFYLDEWSAQ